MAVFKGTATAIATPFRRDGSVDYDAYSELIDWQIQQGVDAIVAAGTTGEASTLDDAEHVAVVRSCVAAVKGRVPVIAGAGSNDTRHGANLAKMIEDVGADALLLVTPYYNKCSQKGLVEHYKKTVEGLKIPSILYSVPSRTGVNIKPETVAELAQDEHFVAIKEASGDISQVAEICRVVPKGFDVYSGNDDMVIPLMSLGGIGVISVLSNIAPADTVKMTHAALKNDWKTAAKLQLGMKPLIDAIFADVNPIPIKSALAMMGWIKEIYRLPLCPPSRKVKNELKKAMQDYGLI